TSRSATSMWRAGVTGRSGPNCGGGLSEESCPVGRFGITRLVITGLRQRVLQVEGGLPVPGLFPARLVQQRREQPRGEAPHEVVIDGERRPRPARPPDHEPVARVDEV